MIRTKDVVELNTLGIVSEAIHKTMYYLKYFNI